MQLVVIGINHVTASIEMREKFAIAPERHKSALIDAINVLQAADGKSASKANSELVEAPPEVAVLSTCNRTEIIANRPDHAEALLQWLGDFCGQPVSHEHFFVHTEEMAWRHLASVASGLDSLALGEPQIFGQLKSAYAIAKEVDAVGEQLDATFQHLFLVAKRVRHDTAIGENPISIAYAAVSLVKRIFSALEETRVLLIGAGETVTLVATHLKDAGVSGMTVANRNLVNASDLAEQFNGSPIILADIPDRLAEHDIVISSTASQLPLLGKGTVETAIKQRKRKPMFMLDLAVPRDIEHEVASLPDVYLYSVDDLRDVIDQNIMLRKRELSKAEALIEQGLKEFLQRQKQRTVSTLLVDYRKTMDALAQQELDKARRQLASGQDIDEVLENLTRNISRKLMHDPTVAIREAATKNDRKFIETVEKLLGFTRRDR